MGGMLESSADNVTGRQARQHGRSSDVGRRLDGRDDQRGNGGGGADRDGGGQIQAAQQTLLGQTRFRRNIGRNDLRRFDGRHIGLLGQWQTINGRHFQSVGKSSSWISIRFRWWMLSKSVVFTLSVEPVRWPLSSIRTGRKALRFHGGGGRRRPSTSWPQRRTRRCTWPSSMWTRSLSPFRPPSS